MKTQLRNANLTALAAVIVLLGVIVGLAVNAQSPAVVPLTGGAAAVEPVLPSVSSNAITIGPDFSAWSEQERALYQITESYNVPIYDPSRMTDQERAYYQITESYAAALPAETVAVSNEVALPFQRVETITIGPDHATWTEQERAYYQITDPMP